LAALLPWDVAELQHQLAALTSQGESLKFDPENERYILTAVAQKLEDQISQHLKAYHQRHPLKPGLSKEELRTQLPRGVGPGSSTFCWAA